MNTCVYNQRRKRGVKFAPLFTHRSDNNEESNQNNSDSKLLRNNTKIGPHIDIGGFAIVPLHNLGIIAVFYTVPYIFN